LYTAKAHTTGGRDGGASRTSDGHLDVKLSTPGTAGAGTNVDGADQTCPYSKAAWGNIEVAVNLR